MSIPTLPTLPAYPATGTEAERSQWLTLASLHMQSARLDADKARMDQFERVMSDFSRNMAQNLPPLGSMEFEQAVELLKLIKGAP